MLGWVVNLFHMVLFIREKLWLCRRVQAWDEDGAGLGWFFWAANTIPLPLTLTTMLQNRREGERDWSKVAPSTRKTRRIFRLKNSALNHTPKTKVWAHHFLVND